MDNKASKTSSNADLYIENSCWSKNVVLFDEEKTATSSTEVTDSTDSAFKEMLDGGCNNNEFKADYNTPMIIKVNKYRLYKKGDDNGDNL